MHGVMHLVLNHSEQAIVQLLSYNDRQSPMGTLWHPAARLRYYQPNGKGGVWVKNP